MPAKKTSEEIIIKVPRKLYDKRVQKLIDYIEFRKIVSKSKASDKELGQLLLTIKKERGTVVKEMLKRINSKA